MSEKSDIAKPIYMIRLHVSTILLYSIYIILIYSGLESYVAKTTRTIFFIWGKQLPVRQGYLHKWDVYGIKRIGMINILYNKDICNMQYCTGI